MMGSPRLGSACILKAVTVKGAVAALAGGSWEHAGAHLKPTAKGELLLVPLKPHSCQMALKLCSFQSFSHCYALNSYGVEEGWRVFIAGDDRLELQ